MSGISRKTKLRFGVFKFQILINHFLKRKIPFRFIYLLNRNHKSSTRIFMRYKTYVSYTDILYYSSPQFLYKCHRLHNVKSNIHHNMVKSKYNYCL